MKKQKHLIALDLDGTLLRNDHTISPKTKTIIKQLIDDGHIVVIATGRSNRVSIHYYHELGLNTPLINSNGAIVHHPIDKTWQSTHTPINHHTAHHIIDMCYDLKAANILAAVQDNVYLEQFDQRIVDFYQVGHDDESFQIGGVKQLLQDDPSLLMIYPEEKQVAEITSYLNDSHAQVIAHRNWGPPFHVIEIINAQINKAAALKQVAAHYQIPQERIIAFGDEGNDLEMIDYAGVGVAMGNGIDALKSIAKHVTGTNEADGIGEFLLDYFSVPYVK